MAQASGRRRTVAQISTQLRELRLQLGRLNHQVGVVAELRDSDLDCLDQIARSGGIGPSALARRLGVHPATLTGLLDRLESGGWVQRERQGGDRRAVTLTVPADRQRELFGYFAGMTEQLGRVCADYDEQELELIARFLDATVQAGAAATAELSAR